MAKILAKDKFITPVLLKTNDGLVLRTMSNLRGNALSVTVDGVVAGTGSWTTVLIEVEYSVDNGATWLAASDTIFASATSAEVVTEITAIKGTDIRFIATTLVEASLDPTLTLEIEVRVI